MLNEVMGKCSVSKTCNMSKEFVNALVDQPVLGSIFVADFFLVFFLKTPHWIFSLLMMGGLVGMSMYYGQKMALFQCKKTESVEQSEQKD